MWARVNRPFWDINYYLACWLFVVLSEAVVLRVAPVGRIIVMTLSNKYTNKQSRKKKRGIRRRRKRRNAEEESRPEGLQFGSCLEL